MALLRHISRLGQSVGDIVGHLSATNKVSFLSPHDLEDLALLVCVRNHPPSLSGNDLIHKAQSLECNFWGPSYYLCRSATISCARPHAPAHAEQQPICHAAAPGSSRP